MSTQNPSAISFVNSDRQKAAKIVTEARLPNDLKDQLGDSCLQVDLGHQADWTLRVTKVQQAEEDFVLSLSLSCIEDATGNIAPFGEVDVADVAAQRDAADSDYHWYSLSAKVLINSDELDQTLLDGFTLAAEYHQDADTEGLGLSERLKEHPMWCHGSFRFLLAPGGAYGLYISAADIADLTFHGKGIGSPALETCSLQKEAVEDVSDLFGGTSPKPAVAVKAKRPTVSTRRR